MRRRWRCWCGRRLRRSRCRPIRRRGVARRLLGEAEAAARALGLPRLHLGTRLVLADNRALFASCGFVEVGRHAHPGFAVATWVEMEKRVG